MRIPNVGVVRTAFLVLCTALFLPTLSQAETQLKVLEWNTHHGVDTVSTTCSASSRGSRAAAPMSCPSTKSRSSRGGGTRTSPRGMPRSSSPPPDRLGTTRSPSATAEPTDRAT